jgi:phage terminase small subunit
MDSPPPPTLGKVAAEKWRELAPRMQNGNPVALVALEVYCASYARWLDAQRWLDEHGDVLEIVSDKGVVIKVQPAPKLDVAARCERAMAEAATRIVFRVK